MSLVIIKCINLQEKCVQKSVRRWSKPSLYCGFKKSITMHELSTSIKLLSSVFLIYLLTFHLVKILQNFDYIILLGTWQLKQLLRH